MSTTPSSAINDALKDRTRIQTDTYAEILRLLGLAQEQITAILTAAPSNYQSWSLPQISAAIEQAMGDFNTAGGATMSSAAGSMWENGQSVVDLPMQAGGIKVATVMPVIDNRQLLAMRAFTTGRIKDISTTTANKINSQLGLVVIGAQSPGDAITNVKDLLTGEAKNRARTIVRTELGSVFSAAGFQRMLDAKASGVHLKKKWLKSGKAHARPGHNAMHGKVLELEDPFLLLGMDGNTHKLMHPHDPKAPASEKINCGCVVVPVIDFSKPIVVGNLSYQSKLTSTIPDGVDLAEFNRQELAGRSNS